MVRARKLLVAASLVVAAALTASAANATVISLTPTQDAQIKISTTDGTTTNNYNTVFNGGTLVTRSAAANDMSKSFLRFTLPADMAGATINSVTLTLSADTAGHNSNKTDQFVGLTEGYDSWSETTLTWNSSGTLGNDIAPSAKATSSNNWGFASGAITATFNSAADGLWPTDTTTINKTFNLMSNGTALTDFLAADTNGSITIVMVPNSSVTVLSKDAASVPAGSTIPTLAIDYTPAPEPASLGLLAIGGLGLLARRRRI